MALVFFKKKKERKKKEKKKEKKEKKKKIVEHEHLKKLPQLLDAIQAESLCFSRTHPSNLVIKRRNKKEVERR